MKIAVGNSRMDKKWKNQDISWADLCARCGSTIRTTETVEEYRKLKKGQQDGIKDVGGFVGGHLREGRRKNGMVLCRSLLTLDMDYGTPDIWDEITLFHDFKCCVYSTHKHTPGHPRLRLLIPLKREISEEEYPAVARMVAKEIGIDLFDDTTYEASRLMYWPSTSSNGEFFYKVQDGAELDPDEYLSHYDDWHDASTWPVSSRQSEVVQHTLQNLTVILMNDPLLKPLVFNQLLDGMEIKGDVPWRHPSKFWRDADDAQLISYVDSHYGTFSARNYDIAVAKVTDDRSYHPIREFIENLPEWDKVPRVDTLLIDYLGADDNEYVRAVTRKTLCAAIKRVLYPGCKFDSMLVLNGPQGVGKSTLIAKLAGEWFSDSLNLGDTKDKTAAEKLQGYWILEIGELAGLKKAEVETLRSFLSRQNDIYRAAFGKRATPHLRQCVFFGTTNAESGYLRDTTGNRRFWPVKTPGTGIKHSWDLTPELICQIWAETLVYVKQGEKLYLSAELEALSKAEQREAMESDEREGLVRLYLDTLLPEDWDGMDIFERRNFLTGSDFGDTQKHGTVKRTQVSNMEIWCECFGKERANIRRTDSNELTAILARLGWKRLDSKVRIPLYGPQYVFVPKECS